MLKDKLNKVKVFVGEHKKEILIGGLCIAGAIIGYKGMTMVSKMVKETNHNNNEHDLYVRAYNKAVDIANNVLIPNINDKYKDYDFSDIENDINMQRIYNEYVVEYETKFNDLIKEQIDKLR